MKVFDLQRFLKEKKYTQKELAGLLSCTQPYLSAVLAGKKRFSEDRLKLIQSYFGNIDSYITEVEDTPNNPSPSLNKYNQGEEVIINRNILDLLQAQSEAILSQQRTMEKMIDDKMIQSETMLSQQRTIENMVAKKTNVQEDENVGCAGVSGSDLGK